VKSVHLNREGVKKPLTEWLKETGELEKEDKNQAISEYKKIAVAYPTSEHPYDRLMILYRQQKDYPEELKWIEKAIAVFTKTFDNAAKKPNAKITAISKSLTKSLGLTDKKGRPLYQHQPIARWEKRRELLIKKSKLH
jgi:tetratricopeptide (TPR) repeat protein